MVFEMNLLIELIASNKFAFKWLFISDRDDTRVWQWIWCSILLFFWSNPFKHTAQLNWNSYAWTFFWFLRLWFECVFTAIGSGFSPVCLSESLFKWDLYFVLNIHASSVKCQRIVFLLWCLAWLKLHQSASVRFRANCTPIKMFGNETFMKLIHLFI